MDGRPRRFRVAPGHLDKRKQIVEKFQRLFAVVGQILIRQ
jgi:hypothetical protein